MGGAVALLAFVAHADVGTAYIPTTSPRSLPCSESMTVQPLTSFALFWHVFAPMLQSFVLRISRPWSLKRSLPSTICLIMIGTVKARLSGSTFYRFSISRCHAGGLRLCVALSMRCCACQALKNWVSALAEPPTVNEVGKWCVMLFRKSSQRRRALPALVILVE